MASSITPRQGLVRFAPISALEAALPVPESGPSSNGTVRQVPVVTEADVMRRCSDIVGSSSAPRSSSRGCTPTIAAPHGSYLAVLRRGTGEEHSIQTQKLADCGPAVSPSMCARIALRGLTAARRDHNPRRAELRWQAGLGGPHADYESLCLHADVWRIERFCSTRAQIVRPKRCH